MDKFFKIFLALFLIGSICFIVLSYLFAKAFISSNHISIANPPSEFNFENVSFRTSDNILIKGWYSKFSDSSKTMILLHGYKANRTEMISRAKIFRQAGYNVLLYDARGCGESEGEFISFGYYESKDLLAAIRFLNKRGERSIAVYGFSQGGATIIMASDSLKEIKCVIIEATYDKLVNAIDNRFKSTLNVPGKFGALLMIPFAESKLGINVNEIEPIEKISKLNFPIFVIGGEKDEKTLTENIINLFEAANKPKELWIAENSGHADIFSNNSELYQTKVINFLDDNFK